MVSGVTEKIKALREALRALRNRNYRLFFIGQGISLIGVWMQTIAVGWLVYRMTRSEMMLGIVAFAGQAPVFFLSPFAGVIGDRFDRRRILVIMQVLALLQALTLAILTFSGAVRVWHVVLLGAVLGLVNAFEMPTRQAFVVELVDARSDLPNAIALNSALFTGARLIGPAMAGLIVVAAGEGACFLANAASYPAALVALLMMSIPRREEPRSGGKLLPELKEGLAYAFGFPPIRALLAVIGLLSLTSMSFPVLLPAFASEILHGGPNTYGFLVAASGVGALGGTLFLAMRKSVLGLERVISISLVFFGIVLGVFSFSRFAPLSMAILALVGFWMILTMASCTTILQTIVEEKKRARVMGLYVMVFMGAAPLGSIIAGGVSTAIGPPLTILAAGGVSVIGGLVFARRVPVFRRLMRPIYHKMGIIPEVAIGIQTSEELQTPPE
ncbi:MAG: MFS transporter [Chrysiogenales bacterium]|nr:MAG: MFS transporter [Chrysiogenales bacterium]